MILRLARVGEAEKCYQFIEDGRAYHRSLGFEQWHPGYPTPETILTDIAEGIGYVFAEDDQPLGYCCITFGVEPVYNELHGKWLTHLPYAVVHRMAFGKDSRGKGLSHDAFALIKDLCRRNGIPSLRMDTQGDNKTMLHVLEREGFTYCGWVYLDGGPKLAYELPL